MNLQEEAEYVRSLKQASTEARRLADEAKEAAVLAEQEFFAHMESEGVQSIKVNGTLYVPQSTIYGQVQDRAEFMKWAEAEHPELIEPRERKALLNELVREALDRGDDLPPGLGWYDRSYVSQRIG